jgi:hypothetical protein
MAISSVIVAVATLTGGVLVGIVRRELPFAESIPITEFNFEVTRFYMDCRFARSLFDTTGRNLSP